jgi:hypothetical protein
MTAARPGDAFHLDLDGTVMALLRWPIATGGRLVR